MGKNINSFKQLFASDSLKIISRDFGKKCDDKIKKTCTHIKAKTTLLQHYT